MCLMSPASVPVHKMLSISVYLVPGSDRVELLRGNAEQGLDQ